MKVVKRDGVTKEDVNFNKISTLDRSIGLSMVVSKENLSKGYSSKKMSQPNGLNSTQIRNRLQTI